MSNFINLNEVWIDAPRKLADGTVEIKVSTFPLHVNMDLIFTMNQSDFDYCHAFESRKDFVVPKSFTIDETEYTQLTKLYPPNGSNPILVLETPSEIKDLLDPPKPKRGRPSKKKD